MKRTEFGNLVCAFVMAASMMALSAAPGGAYSTYRTEGSANCSACHPGFIGGFVGAPLHDAHTAVTTNCELCHPMPNPEIVPVSTQSSGGGEGGDQGCRGCHGVEPMEGMPAGSWGAGLRLHHVNAGAPPDGFGLTCQQGCHAGDPLPLPEDTVPLYYPREDTAVEDPCADNLDNDGDLLYDGDDLDCFRCTSDAECEDGLFCNGAEICNTDTGDCEGGAPVDCDDGVACTEDACDEDADECVNTPDDRNCPDDGMFCTGEEFCDPVGDCSSTGDPCMAGQICNEEADICEEAPPVLTVAKAGSGSGTVGSDPAGIDCGMDCMESYDPGTEVTLTATRDSGSTFDGWSGDCSGTLASTSVLMDADKTCTATFAECVPLKDVSGQMISDAQSFEACNALTAGSFQILGPGGDVTFMAGEEISLQDGFTVGSGATFTAVIDPSLMP